MLVCEGEGLGFGVDGGEVSVGFGLGAGADDDLVGAGRGPGALDELCVLDGVFVLPLPGFAPLPEAPGDGLAVWLPAPWRRWDALPLGLAEGVAVGLAVGLDEGVVGDVAAVVVAAA